MDEAVVKTLPYGKAQLGTLKAREDAEQRRQERVRAGPASVGEQDKTVDANGTTGASSSGTSELSVGMLAAAYTNAAEIRRTGDPASPLGGGLQLAAQLQGSVANLVRAILEFGYVPKQIKNAKTPTERSQDALARWYSKLRSTMADDVQHHLQQLDASSSDASAEARVFLSAQLEDAPAASRRSDAS